VKGIVLRCLGITGKHCRQPEACKECLRTRMQSPMTAFLRRLCRIRKTRRSSMLGKEASAMPNMLPRRAGRRCYFPCCPRFRPCRQRFRRSSTSTSTRSSSSSSSYPRHCHQFPQFLRTSNISMGVPFFRIRIQSYQFPTFICIGTCWRTRSRTPIMRY
jgi:hypothetical protein